MMARTGQTVGDCQSVYVSFSPGYMQASRVLNRRSVGYGLVATENCCNTWIGAIGAL